MNKHTRDITLSDSLPKDVAIAIKKIRADTHDELSTLGASPPIVGSSIRQEMKFFPLSESWKWFCLNQPNTTIRTDTTPDLAAEMRNLKARFKPWKEDISTFDSTAWNTNGVDTGVLTLAKNAVLVGTVTSSGGKLVFSVAQSLTSYTVLILSTGAVVHIISGEGTTYTPDIEVSISGGTARIATYEELLIRAMYYAQEAHGGFTNWFCLTLVGAVGNIPAGDYPITGLSIVNNTISIATAAAAGNGSGTWADCIEIYPYRIPGSKDARHYSIAEHNLVAAGGGDCAIIAGMMRLGYSQSFVVNAGTTVAFWYGTSGWGAVACSNTNIAPSSDGISGSFHMGKTTHGADFGVYIYVFAGRVVNVSS